MTGIGQRLERPGFKVIAIVPSTVGAMVYDGRDTAGRSTDHIRALVTKGLSVDLTVINGAMPHLDHSSQSTLAIAAGVTRTGGCPVGQSGRLREESGRRIIETAPLVDPSSDTRHRAA